jgi:hypothetical protein
MFSSVFVTPPSPFEIPFAYFVHVAWPKNTTDAEKGCLHRASELC